MGNERLLGGRGAIPAIENGLGFKPVIYGIALLTLTDLVNMRRYLGNFVVSSSRRDRIRTVSLIWRVLVAIVHALLFSQGRAN